MDGDVMDKEVKLESVNIKVRAGDSLMIPIGDSVFMCVFLNDRWCIHETQDDKLQSVYFLPHVLMSALVDYVNMKVKEEVGAKANIVTPGGTVQ